jgi:hypothetical protein
MELKKAAPLRRCLTVFIRSNPMGPESFLKSDQSRYKVFWFGIALELLLRLFLFSLSFLFRRSFKIIITITTMTPISAVKKRPFEMKSTMSVSSLLYV